jgi:hypothetical protein
MPGVANVNPASKRIQYRQPLAESLLFNRFLRDILLIFFFHDNILLKAT